MLPYLGPEFTELRLAKNDASLNKVEVTAPPSVYTASHSKGRESMRYLGRYSQTLIFLAQVIRMCLM
jgi:hypothetical protein